ncbi:MAG: cobalamin-dependent protein [Clostridiales bacterium]|nr:cobalamin-dependent protein [Clostridiales bacterium]
MSAEQTDILERARLSIIEGDDEEALQIMDQASEEGMDLMDLLMEGFGKGNQEIMDRFDRGEITVAELLYASDTMKEVTDEIFKRLGLNDTHGPVATGKIRVLLATVSGDIHDIGKTIVAAFLRNAGFEVIDLGCEVSVEAIALAAREFNVDIIGTSALLTASLKEQKKLEKYLRDIGERDRYITMVGGAPCTERWAEKIGADGYSETANEAVEKALELIKRKKQNGSE